MTLLNITILYIMYFGRFVKIYEIRCKINMSIHLENNLCRTSEKTEAPTQMMSTHIINNGFLGY